MGVSIDGSEAEAGEDEEAEEGVREGTGGENPLSDAKEDEMDGVSREEEEAMEEEGREGGDGTRGGWEREGGQQEVDSAVLLSCALVHCCGAHCSVIANSCPCAVLCV